MKMLFIDRDGVINKDPGGWTKTNYVTDCKDFHFVPGALQALEILKENGIKVIVASNQGGINKGLYTKAELNEVNSLMLKEIEKAGGAIEEVFYCIHRDEDNCGCRKPKPGILESAAKKYGIDPKTTYFIGDAKTDVMAAKNAGCKSILVLSGKSSREDIDLWETKPDYVFENLLETVKWLMAIPQGGLMKKILVVYATAGIGHKKAAMAVKKAYDEMKLPGVEVTLIDALDYTNGFFRWSYLQAYLLMVNKLPTFWGLSYYLTDIPLVDLFVSSIRRLNNWANSKKLVKYILDMKPDVIISTHFFGSEVIADLKQKGRILSKLITIVTDYRLHAWWICEGTDAYIAASEDTRRDLEKRKVDPERIKVMGIPVEPIFSKSLDKPKIFKETGLRDDLFTILVIGGGFGVGPIEGIVKVIAQISRELQVVVVCGHNEELVRKIQSLKDEYKLNMKVLGFIDNVYEYMDISDILISKSGGITVSESLAKEIPLVVISPILGQETGNSAFLVRNNAAVKVKRLDDLKAALESLISDPVKLDKMKEAIKLIEKPYAAYDVAKFAYEYDK